MWTHLTDRHDEPFRGDEIKHVNDLGEPNGKVSEVKAVLSEDRLDGEDYFEVVDNYNSVHIIKHFDDTTWIVTEEP